MSSIIGIIGGSGFYTLGDDSESITVSTPYSDKPVTIHSELVSGRKVLFLPRHGSDHSLPPHRINYRANLWALKEQGVDAILAANVVGGITETMAPGTLVIPDQVIDYTWGREHTFFDELDAAENHVDFTWPYDSGLRKTLAVSAVTHYDQVRTSGTYGCTQGPRLESAAEITRMARDGCDIVGMTGMPEVALARELGIPYASLALVVNWGAGITEETISFAQISATLESGIGQIREILESAIGELS